MLSWYSQPEVSSQFDHIWNAPFSPCLPFLPPLSMKIIGYKTSVKSHSSPPSTPARPHSSSSHNKTPLNLVNGALNVVDRRRRFSSHTYNSYGCNSHWPQAPSGWPVSLCFLVLFQIPALQSLFYLWVRFIVLLMCDWIKWLADVKKTSAITYWKKHHVKPDKGGTLQVAITLMGTISHWWRSVDYGTERLEVFTKFSL